MEVDLDEEHSPGWKFNEHELRGVPVRIELGPKDIENEQAVLVRRDVAGKEGKEFVPRTALPERLRALLAEIQENMLRQATEFRDENTRRAESYGEFKKIIEEKRGFVLAPWDGTEETEQKIKEERRLRFFALRAQEERPRAAGGPDASSPDY